MGAILDPHQRFHTWRARSVDEYCRLPGRLLKFQPFRNLGAWQQALRNTFHSAVDIIVFGRVFSDQRLFQTGSVLVV